MSSSFVLLSALILCTGFTALAEDTITLSGCIRDGVDVPLGNLTLDLTGQVDGETLTTSVKTDADGKFSIEVPQGEWKGVPDEEELLTLGYFCLPGFEWDPSFDFLDGSEDRFVFAPGEIVQVPSPKDIELIAVPVMPTLKVREKNEKQGLVLIDAAFEFPEEQAPADFFGDYEILRSVDMKTWETAMVLMLNSSFANTFTDLAQDDADQCYYKARRFGPLFLTAKTEAE